MPGEPVRIGPFVGGLNTLSDETSIGDTEVAQLINFDLDVDGSLVSRPPFFDIDSDMTLDSNGGITLLGYYVTSTGSPMLIGNDGDHSTYYFDGTDWALLTNTIAASAVCQYNDILYLVAPIGASNPGGSWNGTAFTGIATMPKGAAVTVFKERLWIVPGKDAASNGSRIHFCELTDPTDWPGNFIGVNSGDGQNAIDVCVYLESLIIFKNDSTYRYSYDTDPALGVVSRVTDTVGILDTGCYAQYENRLYVAHDRNVYEVSNYNYERINDKVPLKAVAPGQSLTKSSAVSYFSDRLFVSFYDTLFVYSIKVRTWSVWESVAIGAVGKIFPIPGSQDIKPAAYTYSRIPLSKELYRITDAYDDDTEDMVCIVKTKNYDYQNSHAFKRLFWWGIDCISQDEIRAYINPVRYSNKVTWGEVKEYTWYQLKAYTWGNLLSQSHIIMDEVEISNLSNERKFIKFIKDNRFRQISYRLEFDTDGSSHTAPVRLFNLTTIVRDKAKVPTRIS